MLDTEKLLTFAEAAKSLPHLNGKRIAVSTIWRWALHGLRGVKLESRRIGRRFVTSQEALERFTVALAAFPPQSRLRSCRPGKSTFRPRSAKQRERAVARAHSELEAAGVAVSNTGWGAGNAQGD